jgi:phenylacetate-CoA ligase
MPEDANKLNSFRGWPVIMPAAFNNALALQFQLDESETWAPEKMLRHQLYQLRRILIFAKQTVPLYRHYAIDLSAELNLDAFRNLPILNRAALQAAGEKRLSRDPPKEQGALRQSFTSGSTSEPLTTYGNRHSATYNQATSFREHRWHNRDPRGIFAALRPNKDGQAKRPKLWSWLPDGGLSHTIDLNQSLAKSLDDLLKIDPDYLQVRPRALLEMVRLGEKQGRRPGKLQHAIIFGESVSADHLTEITGAWNIKTFNNYSAVEVGSIAIQCPEAGNLHIQSENVFCEILDDDDEPVAIGETGRVVLSTLHNFAAPMIRYDIGDYARRGADCSCGRLLPVIDRIAGRVKNIVILPNGERRFPGAINYISRLAPILQYRLHQSTHENFTLKLKVARPLSSDEEQSIRDCICRELAFPLNITIEYVDELHRDLGRKYQEFTTDVED